jgi:8-oxo-dGTP pyrophosphatase MutT (NUDIX family)
MAKAPVLTQISAGGVAFRKQKDQIEVALISVGSDERWQLPKGLIDSGEATEAAALREVREEAGVETELIQLIDKVEYWYYSTQRGQRVRFHKFVYFFLLRYLSGDVHDHDKEVNEARWVEIDQAHDMLAFKSEKQIVQQAKALIEKC